MTSQKQNSLSPADTGEIIRLLSHLASSGAGAVVASSAPGSVVLTAPRKGVSLSRGTVPLAVADSALAQGAVKWCASKGFAITPAGRTMLERHRQLIQHKEVMHEHPLPPQAGGTMAFSKPKRAIRVVELREKDGPRAVAINDAESPLAWLHRRRDRGGEPFIDATCFEAGERLRRDVTLAQLLPQVTANWTRAGSRGTANASPTDTMIAARQRIDHALNAMDADFAGILLDVCGFLKGLEEVERERKWPPRSGKVLLKLALTRLATHYGMSSEIRGPRSGIRTWKAP